LASCRTNKKKITNKANGMRILAIDFKNPCPGKWWTEVCIKSLINKVENSL